MKIAGLILAGGKSNRLGEHKFQKSLNGVPLLDHVVSRLSQQVDRLAVNLPHGCINGDFTTLYEAAESAGKTGPLAGVLLGLNWAKSINADVLMTMPIDVPFFPQDTVSKLLTSFSDNAPVCVTENQKRHGLCTLWPVDCLSAFSAAFNNDDVRTVNRMLDILNTKDVRFGAKNYLQFFNINTAEDIEVAEQILKQQGLKV